MFCNITCSGVPPPIRKSELGEWRRKKGPAPPRPKPQKRTIRKLPMRQIQQELHDIEIQQMELERQGVLLEKSIRARSESSSGAGEWDAENYPQREPLKGDDVDGQTLLANQLQSIDSNTKVQNNTSIGNKAMDEPVGPPKPPRSSYQETDSNRASNASTELPLDNSIEKGTAEESRIIPDCEKNRISLQSNDKFSEASDNYASGPSSLDVEDMIMQLFELVNLKNELFRRQTELMYL